ncbi:hypothetical protein [Pseudoalteromonas phage PHS3]|nr:hypothetical protein [Pseudoalteromonas phage PHS3]WMM36549.1 hypothetical protein [Pseudoalteromonas phage PS_L5]
MPRKKYNKMKGALASARVGLKNLAVFHSQKDSGEKYTCLCVNFKTGEQIKVGQSMAFAISEIRHKWNIHLIASGKESNGKTRFEVDQVPITEPLLQSDLVEYLDWRHKEHAANFEKRNELTNVSWLAVPNGDDITNEQIDLILTKYGAW